MGIKLLLNQEIMFNYQELIDLLPTEEIYSAIKRMVDNFDLTGNYHGNDNHKYFVLNGESLLKEYFDLSPEFLSLINNYALKEYEKEKSVGIPYISFFDAIEKNVEYQRTRIYDLLMDYLESEAKKIVDNREHLRIPVGNIVDFEDCMLSNKYLGKVEFYKEGGWGIAEEDGTVLVKNHLMKQPSKTYSLYCGFSYIKTPYRIIQDRDTKKYGILSYESFYESVHCLYDKIEVIDFYEESQRHFFITAMRNGKWGCFDERCALIIGFEYDLIQVVNGFLECVRDAEYLLNDTLYERNDKYVIVGKRDLYDKEGSLWIGGFDNLIIDYNYLKFYFGTSYDHYTEEETDFQGRPCPVYKVRLNFQKSKCLVLDKEFKTIINNGKGFFRMPRGHMFKSIEELERLVPLDYLLRFGVDLSDLDNGFIYLYNYHGEQYFVPDYIQEGFSSPEERYNYKVSKSLTLNDSPIMEKPFDFEATDLFYDNRRDLYVDDSIITIIMLNERKEFAWINYANEIERTEYFTHLYRKGKKYGLFDTNGFKPAYFDAITRESPDHKIYYASFEYCHDPNSADNNPNYIYWKHLYIRYYIMEDENYIRVEDDWKIFNPRKCKWFPYDFLISNYDDYDVGASDYSLDRGYEWTDEDAWDAMTDGMYGDYPGSGWDPESFGF